MASTCGTITIVSDSGGSPSPDPEPEPSPPDGGGGGGGGGGGIDRRMLAAGLLGVGALAAASRFGGE